MAIEIELKAHVADSQAIKLLLSEKAQYLGAFEKEDSYWFPKESSSESSSDAYSGQKKFRIRKEKLVSPEGIEKSAYMVGYKRKEVRDGIEINDEQEFEARPSETVEEFFRELGLEPRVSKRKRGWAYSLNGITAELVHVEGLGWFVELEILEDGKLGESFEVAKTRLLDLLFNLGIDKKSIESRYYTEMLLAKTETDGAVDLSA